MQDKLDQKATTRRMRNIKWFHNETFLDYLYHLKTEDKVMRAEKERLHDFYGVRCEIKGMYL
jgi:hypothetical protein